ncbi:MAG: sugar ABC transporter ATP-binding protein [Armatimonadota bacterium]|nr:sugar ABC transporter ATP-binding protein [Armatimonadota bacterium]
MPPAPFSPWTVDTRPSRPDPVLRLVSIHKSFPGVHALRGVSLDLRPGEIHILLGENGAGKSTLLRIAGGALLKDAGQIYVLGRRVELRSVQHARQLGIGMVHQELSLVPDLSVAENLLLGQWPRRRFGLVDWREMRARARQVLEDLEVHLDPDRPIWELSIAERQLVEIARVLGLEVRILLLDEPTSALPESDRKRLFRILRELRNRGVAVVYTSHRLAEVWEIGDRVTVLRDGQEVGTFPVQEVDEGMLVRLMVGRTLQEHLPKVAVSPGPPLLEVSGLAAAHVSGVSFQLRTGEIVGVFGLRGSGRSTLARALFGLERIRSGTIRVDGKPVEIHSPRDAIRAGLGYLTEDRREGLVPLLPVPPNITLASLRRFVRRGFLDRTAERDMALRLMEVLAIQPPTPWRPALHFSGGNQQKILLARWLASGARILILDEPTRGIDVGAKSEVFALVGQLAQQGVGVLLLSSEIPELLAVADRILVLRSGRLTAEFSREEASQEAILRAATELKEAASP